MMAIRPLPNHDKRAAGELSPWQKGTTKPQIDGEYLRRFEEGEAISEFHAGQWLRDGFFLSDIQDAPWRGLGPKARQKTDHTAISG